jgi:hypothetical protein
MPGWDRSFGPWYSIAVEEVLAYWIHVTEARGAFEDMHPAFRLNPKLLN